MKLNLKTKLFVIICLTSLMTAYHQPVAGRDLFKSVAKQYQKSTPKYLQLSASPSTRFIFLPSVESPAPVLKTNTIRNDYRVQFVKDDIVVGLNKDNSGLSLFVSSFLNQSKGGQVTGVYAPGAFALSVVQQPAGDMLYVSAKAEELTQFRRAKQAGSVGLLAHNNLAGRKFLSLSAGSLIYLIYGDGRVQTYEVYQVEDYQALSLTVFRDLVTGKSVDQYTLFDHIYHANNDRVVFQTCLEKKGATAWGRRFILAKLVQENYSN